MLVLNEVEKIIQNKDSQHYALKNIHFEVQYGEIVGILGRAHSGKTTLLRCIHLLERPSHGSIVFEHSSLTDLSESDLRASRRLQGMVFQEPNLLQHCTVYENMTLPLSLSGVKPENMRAIILPLLQLVGLLDKENTFAKDLNLSQQYRVCIARALVLHPKLLMLDDITRKCDTKTSLALLKLLRDINEKMNVTILLATQDMEVIKSICHRVLVLYQGEIIEQNTVLNLFTHPKEEISKEFVKTAARLEMPTALRKRLKPQWNEYLHPVIRLSFAHQDSREALIAQTVQQFGLMMNILQAHLEPVRDEDIGILVLELRGPRTDVQNAIHFLEEHGLSVEVLGYVA